MLTITTCEKYPQPSPNIVDLQKELTQFGVKSQIKTWQNTHQSDFVLPLCAWDYADNVEFFLDWIKNNASNFINSSELMIWNANKRYLCDLAKWGVEVIPTVICEPSKAQIQKVMMEQHWQEAVIKPTIGQSGQNVMKICKNEDFPDLSLYHAEVVIQPFIKEVATYGETSLIFFNGKFSHSVCRQPAKNEWRANSQYGVEVFARSVSPQIIQTAQDILEKLPEMPVYARVDGTIVRNHFLLNELELIEPALYLHTEKNAVNRFVTVLNQYIQRKTANLF